MAVNERQAFASTPEDVFVELFAQVFGLEKVQLLAHEYPVEDIYGGGRFIDYALRTGDEKVAFEIDGPTHYSGTIAPYEDDLLRQNSLVHQGWRVFRWTDREVMVEQERVKEQLALFLESVPGLLSFDEFLPKQTGDIFEFREHQKEALDSLEQMRAERKTIGLLTHAQGAGKTVVAVADAKRLGSRTLFVAHRRELVIQARDELRKQWPEVSTGLFMGDVRDCEEHNIAASIQSIAENLDDFPQSAFQYLIIDEAHHAAAPTYKRLLGYFKPQFVLGLTATPDRADGQSILDIFRDCAHRLSLREAVERGELAPIRCFRVDTNINLSEVRFNHVQYNRKDIENTVIVEGRDRLIVDTYLKHVRGRKAVAFCVNIRHGESLADLFRNEGVAARSVSGRMPRADREKYLAQFHRGDLRVLCACDILNEGWDCPDVEVLLMARPTLSKVIYMQQLGRGTRKAPGKECLVAIDFVDNSRKHNQSLNLHRIAGVSQYRPGGLVYAPADLKKDEDDIIGRGDRPTAVIDVGIWARDYKEVDIFNWQDTVQNTITVADLEVELAASEGTVRRAIEKKELEPDHKVQLGERTYYYFDRDPERIEQVRVALGLPKVDAHSIKDLFLQYADDRMDMAASYKPVMLLAILDSVDSHGRARLSDVVEQFRRFYDDRRKAGIPVERANARMASVDSLDDADVQRVVLDMPFEKFERRRYLRYDRDLAFVRFEPNLWRQLKPGDLANLRTICDQSIKRYYERLNA